MQISGPQAASWNDTKFMHLYFQDMEYVATIHELW